MSADLIAIPARPLGETSEQLAQLIKITRAIMARSFSAEGGALDDVALKAIREASRLLAQQVAMAEKVADLEAGRSFDRAEHLRAQVFAVLEKYPAASRAVSRALAGQGESG